ncbi:RtcB family protein [Cesiribacter sp. SM1]|uniref:RtcB family protein n=1 Tax=Cesiribacter sp. SM1 TaxID=2861196 RepID=UPI001CD401B7|nr:RtcB family protein [Cesiribacter sp. SM1]
MGQNKLRGKDLSAIHYTSNKAKSLAIDLMARHYKHWSKQEQLVLLQQVQQDPAAFISHELLGMLAAEFMPEPELKPREEVALLRSSGQLQVFGRKGIASNALQQMELAMRLPIAVKGALMPDAHQGYGLPIGGVLATRNAVIPYGVGVDIGCRMSLSIYAIGPEYLRRNAYSFKQSLKEKTCFGTGGELGITQEHPVLDNPAFGLTPLLRQLHGKAVKQLGTSGSGNHFVEWGIAGLEEGNGLGLEKGEYLALLSHSGSRGLGAAIANHYTQLARNSCLLPRQANHFAWLELESEAGAEYWLSMQLAGDYAKACHDQIHYHLSRYMGIKPVARVENHHNFAWKERGEEGEECVVHRKGATPAAEGELGIIPGSMAAKGYIVRGRGNPAGLNSASHGAGRRLSRQQARESFTGSELKKVLSREGVTLIGGGIDEAPIAYKNLEEVMACQRELVDVIGSFTPKIVRMDKN